tara:strand:- start:545 stop:763 length:219 start_codon:yes stop_codon:yes gene_type:complete
MITKNTPENTYYNASILKDFKSFAKGGFNMLDENCNINPDFYDLIEADECGNIIKVNGQPVTQKGTVYFLQD